MTLNPRQVQARSRAMRRITDPTFQEQHEHLREIQVTQIWFGWRGFGYLPHQIVGGIPPRWDLGREVAAAPLPREY